MSSVTRAQAKTATSPAASAYTAYWTHATEESVRADVLSEKTPYAFGTTMVEGIWHLKLKSPAVIQDLLATADERYRGMGQWPANIREAVEGAQKMVARGNWTDDSGKFRTTTT